MDVCRKCNADCCNDNEILLFWDEYAHFISKGANPSIIADFDLIKIMKGPCYFLKNNRCSIHSERALACRIFPILAIQEERHINFQYDYACPFISEYFKEQKKKIFYNADGDKDHNNKIELQNKIDLPDSFEIQSYLGIRKEELCDMENRLLNMVARLEIIKMIINKEIWDKFILFWKKKGNEQNISANFPGIIIGSVENRDYYKEVENKMNELLKQDFIIESFPTNYRDKISKIINHQ